MNGLTNELHLLLLCTSADLSSDDEANIRRILAGGIDWTGFVQTAINHGLAGLAGQVLGGVASDLVPEDISAAFATYLERTRERNRALLDELLRILDALAGHGIEAIPLKGPVLAIQAYGDLALREFQDLDFLVRDRDLASATRSLIELGYSHREKLSAAQLALIHRLQGQEILFGRDGGAALEPHTRLTSMKLAFDIDHEALWERARTIDLDGRRILSLAAEDELIALAVHGGKELWWNVKWACDIAAFARSHQDLDWRLAFLRARQQGCFRMLLLAAALAREFFHAAVPEWVVEAERADPLIARMMDQVLARWRADDPVGPPSSKTVSWNLLQLHDGASRRARYVVKTVFLPGPQHVAMMALPRALSFGYIPIKLVHDAVALPLWRVYQQLRGPASRV